MSDQTEISAHDLRGMFDVVVAAPPTHIGRLAEVERRVRRVHHRRSALGVAFAVFGVLAAGIVVSNGAGNGAAPLAPFVAGPAQYREGGKLIASAFSSDPSGLTLTFTPTSLGLQIFFECSTTRTGGIGKPKTTSLTLNGYLATSSGCLNSNQSGDLGTGFRSSDWASLEVRTGRPSTIRYTVLAGSAATDSVKGVAVYQDVPIDQYVFPTTPVAITDLGEVFNGYQGIGPAPIFSMTATGTAEPPGGIGIVTFQKEVRLTLHKALTLEFAANTPGDIEVTVDGKVIWAVSTWSYSQAQSDKTWTPEELGTTVGQPITITVTVHRYRGNTWALAGYDVAAAVPAHVSP